MTGVARMRVWCGLLGLAGVLAAVPAQAHPHVWIDARYQIQVGPDRMVRAVAVEWTFDEIYSQASREIIDINQDQTLSAEELQGLIDGAITRLKEWNYYVDLRQGGRGRDRRLALAPVSERRATEEKGQLVFRFTVPLATPVALADGSLRLRGYDPTLFIGVEPADPHPLTLVPPQPDCRPEIGAPQEPPSRPLMGGPVWVPDKDVPADIKPGSEGIGFAFARVITVTCDQGTPVQ